VEVKVPSTKQSRKDSAIERQKKYDALSIDEKITLAQLRGGSKKELNRLFDKKLKQNKIEE
jgi:hypothetical protein